MTQARRSLLLCRVCKWERFDDPWGAAALAMNGAQLVATSLVRVLRAEEEAHSLFLKSTCLGRSQEHVPDEPEANERAGTHGEYERNRHRCSRPF